jgi:predicted dehydrogenase
MSSQQRDFGSDINKDVSFYVIGAGSRGSGYAELALEDSHVHVMGVAEPKKGRREAFAKQHGLNDARYIKEDWKELLKSGKNADFVLIATLDTQHSEPAIAFMRAGYHVLVEKPMATTPEECLQMVKTAEKFNVMLGVCHVLRYTPYTKTIKQLIDLGTIGKVVSINLVEPVGNWHFAHSYVRGNWRNQQVGAFVLMAKSCHDIDWLRHVTGESFETVMCEGSHNTFVAANKPLAAGDAERCVDCSLQKDCAYSATGIYTERAKLKGVNNETETMARFPYKAIVDKPLVKLVDIEDAVAKGPYGRCVFGGCDNDQPDVVSAIFKMANNGPQVTFEMRSNTEDICKREVTICGTFGEIRGDMTTVELCEFRSNGEHVKSRLHPRTLTREDTRLSGHWGADFYMFNAFCAAVSENNPALIYAGPQETYESHMAVFAAEHARINGVKVNIQDFIVQNM